MATSFAVFDTALGTCGLAWGERGIVLLSLPAGPRGRATRAGLARRLPDAVEAKPPPSVAAAMERVQALVAGKDADLSDIAVDLDGLPAFDLAVYEIARTIRRGDTMTYGEVATRIGAPGEAQAVGAALGRNPVPLIVPCHRVLAAGGRTGGFSAPGGAETKRRLLQIEDAAPGGQPSLFGGGRLDGPPSH